MLWCIAQDFTEKMWGQEEPTLFSSGLLSRFSQVGILISASSGTNFPLRAKRLSLSLSLSLSVFLLFSDMTTCRFLVKTEGEHVCLLYESEVVCGSQCVCLCVLCVPVMVLPCAQSLYGTEWSRIWRKLSGLGYRWKPSSITSSSSSSSSYF